MFSPCVSLQETFPDWTRFALFFFEALLVASQRAPHPHGLLQRNGLGLVLRVLRRWRP